MAVKHYAQIEFDLFSDPKFRGLSSNDVRFIYLTAHCSKLSNYLGIFRYPIEIWSYDSNVKPAEIQAALSELEAKGLVEYDQDTQTLRLIGWFYTLNGPRNGNQMKGHIKSFLGLSRCDPEMLCRSVAEFTVSSFSAASLWENESPEHRKVNDAFRTFLKYLHFKFGTGFGEILENEINASGKDTFGAIQAVFHMLSSGGPSTVEPFRKGFETVSKQEMTGEENTKIQKKTNVVSDGKHVVSASPLSETMNSRLAIEARGSQK